MEEKKINLDTELRDMYDQLSVRNCSILDILRSTFDDTDTPVRTIRDFCQFRETDLLKIRNMGVKSVAEFINFLEKYGLRLGMSQRELAEYEGKIYNPEVRQKEDNIDWESRRWQLACQIFNSPNCIKGMRWAIEQADEFIAMYKEQIFQ